MSIRAATLFSGIGCPELAAPWLDWRFAAEIDPFASAVHAHRFPHIPNLGDVTAPDFIEKAQAHGPIELLVFGSPCQSFSVAGKRGGLDDERGNLALVALDVVERLRPRWFLFENVPGLLSNWSGVENRPDAVPGDEWKDREDSDFAAFLGAVRERGYLGCWRSLDAQYAGVAQRRERVFFVGHLGDWRPAAAVLFEPESLRGDPPPSREAGEGVARPVAASPQGGSGYRNGADTADNLIAFNNTGHGWWGETDASQVVRKGDDNGGGGARESTLIAFGGNRTSGPLDIATAVNAHGGPNGRCDFETETFVTHSLRADGFDASEDGTGRGTPLVAQPYTLAIRGRGDSHDLEARQDGTANAVLTPNGGRGGINVGAVAYQCQGTNVGEAGTLRSGNGHLTGGTPFIPVAFAENSRAELRLEGGDGQTVASLKTGGGKPGQSYPAVAFHARQDPDHGDVTHPLDTDGFSIGIGTDMAVRRLTPRECERLQGLPDDWTLIPYRGKPAADGPRYRAIGNGMAVPVVAWILRRIAEHPRC